MASCQDVQPRLSLFGDGTLSSDERAEISAHLERCADCQGVLHDLERLRTAARRLGPIQPPDHVWLEVAGQIRLGDQPLPARPHSVHARPRVLWQWIGIAAALVLTTLGAYLLTSIQRPGPTSAPAAGAAGNAAERGSVEVVEQELKQAEAHYEKAIAELEAVSTNRDATMDPAAAATLKKNLTVIDQAIAESRGALNSDPQSQPARDSLFEGLRRKVSVLQATVTLMNEMRLGNQEGAARAAAGIGKKS